MSRRAARTKAFFVIFQINFHKEFDFDDIFSKTLLFNEEDNDNFKPVKDKQRNFIYEISSGTYQNIEEIDEIITTNSKWPFDRLNSVDVGILRLALYEIIFRDDIPKSVSANEAVELAKIYGDDDSPIFINGLLGQVLKEGGTDEQ